MTKTLIAVPCVDMVPTGFMQSLLNLRKLPGTAYAVQPGSVIHDTRNAIARAAMDGGFDRVLWLDSDMLFRADLMERLAADMDEKGLEYVSAICFKRVLPTSPCVYREIRTLTGKDGLPDAEAVPYFDYPEDSLFECAATGCAAVMMDVSLVRDVAEAYGDPFQPLPRMGEDLSFCWRAGQLGRKMWCDSRVKVGHIGQMVFDEKLYHRPDAEGRR